MRQAIGAIAAAMLFAAGCAHQRETTAKAETDTASQASVEARMRGQSATVPGMDCTVVSPKDSASVSTRSQQSELKVGDVSNPSFDSPDNEIYGTARSETLATETQAPAAPSAPEAPDAPPPAVASPAPAAPPAPAAAPEAPEAPPPAVASPAPAQQQPPPAAAREDSEAQPPAVASPAPAQKQPSPAPAPNTREEEDTATGGAAQEGSTFENPDMGGAGGGGG